MCVRAQERGLEYPEEPPSVRYGDHQSNPHASGNGTVTGLPSSDKHVPTTALTVQPLIS
ncbi:hypothetical protein DPMN_194849 [Dreissena polymorpha]|uniref:Uncharacterized protein n=1 Tax=Dreissena polymorpha TaxID=45954 RepID=A0A9D3Y3C5_DREPO|nr:hypothetical protein DPMN_194849 [Dreissena polymorpha]